MKKLCILGTACIIVLFFVGYIFFKTKSSEPSLTVSVTEKGTIKPGQTLWSIFKEYEIPQSDILEIIDKFTKVYDTKLLKEASGYEVYLTTSGQFLGFSYSPEPNEEYTVKLSTFGAAKYAAKVNRQQLEKSVVVASGSVTSSLYQGMVSAGLPPDLVMNFADIFESQIDFLTDPVTGDVFRLKAESYKLKGKLVKLGRILSAEYEGRNAKENALWYEYEKGRWEYFNSSGEPLKRPFLRAPLSYRRVSSSFTNARRHPILKKVKPHLGIDYAAPAGTPVSVIGDGKVIFAGWNGGFGKLVKVKHTNGYESWYAHLSRFGSNMRVGKKVLMGSIIGYVGSTGFSTGPHLDFRIRNNDKFLNFLAIKLPFKTTMPDRNMAGFKSFAKSELDFLRADSNISLSRESGQPGE